ncbi:MAG: serine/threonine-protein kinase [Planctomycetota bacterium]
MGEHPLADEFLLKLLPRTGAGDPIIGGMHLKSRLGSGAMGAVFKGHHPRLNVPVAVKILAPNQGSQESNERAGRWFQREAQLLWQVQSTNVVRVSDVGRDETSGLQYMVMDYVRGMDAAAFVEAYTNFMLQPTTTVSVDGNDSKVLPTWQNGLEETIAVRICLAAARGLEAIHDKNIIHRDIKPDNILIPYLSDHTAENDITQVDFDRTQLVDLGVARLEQDNTTTQQGLIVGTPAYMSPEQASGRDVVKASDVYSLGTTLYYLLAGRAPFEGTGGAAIVVKVLTQDPVPITKYCSRLSSATLEVLHRCMSKSSADRYEDGRALRRALEQASAVLPAESETLKLFSLPALSAIARAVEPGAAAMPTPTPAKAPPRGGAGPKTPPAGTPNMNAGPGAKAGTGPAPQTGSHRRGTPSKLPAVENKGEARGQKKAVAAGSASSAGSARRPAPRAANLSAGSGSRGAGSADGRGADKPATTGHGAGSGRKALPEIDDAVGPAGPTAQALHSAPGELDEFLPSEADPHGEQRGKLESALIRLRAFNDEFSTWAALPAAAWGGMTVVGLFYRGYILGGIALLAPIIGAALLPFLMKGRFRLAGVLVSLPFSLAGWWLLDQVGGIFTAGGAAAFAHLRGHAGPPDGGVNAYIGLGVVSVLVAVSLVSIGHAVWFFIHRRKMQEVLAQLAAQDRPAAARRKR